MEARPCRRARSRTRGIPICGRQSARHAGVKQTLAIRIQILISPGCALWRGMYTRDDFERAAAIVYAAMPPTPQYAWPLLAEETQCECWVKHENHTPIGAFKVRGGLVHMRLRKERGQTNGVIT